MAPDRQHGLHRCLPCPPCRPRPLHVLGLPGRRLAARQRHPDRPFPADPASRGPTHRLPDRQAGARPRQTLRPRADLDHAGHLSRAACQSPAAGVGHGPRAGIAARSPGTGMENLRGSVLMVVAMAGFALEDMFIKRLSLDLPVGQILVFLGTGGAVIFGLGALARGHRLFSRDLLAGQVLLRNLGELIGTIGFVTALALTPLSSASAILQATPLALTLGAALFLKEAVGWRRWSAILVGFAGVLMVIRPGLEGFEPASLFAVQAVFGLAMRDLATRAVL